MRREYLFDWCTPGHARDRAIDALKVTGNAVQDVIWEVILNGKIEVVASRIAKFTPSGALIGRQGASPIPAESWVYLDRDASHFWAGEAVLNIPAADGSLSERHFLHALRVEPVQVARIFPAIAPAPAQPAKHQAAWWNEPLVIELAARLHSRELRLTTLTDLEKSARSWLASQNEYPPKKAIRQVIAPFWQRVSQRQPPF